MEKKKTIGGWKKSTSKGEVVEFAINGQRYSMWVNTHKKTDGHPDFNIIENNYKKPSPESKQEYYNQQEHEDKDLPF